MGELTRRQTITLLGSAAAASFTTGANVGAAPSNSLFGRVSRIADEFHSQKAAGLLMGQYTDIFHKVPQAPDPSQVVTVRFVVPENVRVHEHKRESSQRFIWNFTTDEYGLGLVVVDDDDKRETVSHPLTGEAHKPHRFSDLAGSLRQLTTVFKEKRELDAAAIFNTASTYDSTVGGDGVCLCSPNHPHDHGVWSNSFESYRELSREAVADAINATGLFVDEAGLRIHAPPKRLLVPVALMDVAERITRERFHYGIGDALGLKLDYMVYDYLDYGLDVGHTNANNWFIQTQVPGLSWFESQPFTITCELDHRSDAVLVTGHEKRKFGCSDPRAVFGSIRRERA